MKASNALVVILIFAFGLSGRPSSAQSYKNDSVTSMKLAALKRVLEKDERNTKTWWYGWLGGYTAATLAQAAVWATSDELKTRQDMALGAATTFIGAVGQFISPVMPGDEMHRLMAMPENSEAGRLFMLDQAEKLLQKNALAETEGRSLKMHIVSTSVNLCSGLVTWLAFDRTIWAGLGNFTLNCAITEFQIFSQPVRAKKYYERYMLNVGKAPKYSMSLNVGPGSVVLLVKF